MDQPIRRYLEDAIAAEKSFETQLKGFAKEVSDATIQSLFETHAEETRLQYEALTDRLKALGGSTSAFKSFMAHVFNMSPKTAQVGHEKEERTTQDLMMAFSVENAEVAMYEAMAAASEEMGDPETARLAKRIQAQEQETADKIWRLLALTAATAFTAVTAAGKSDARDVIIRYLQDTEAAESNFEDALASFSKTGDQEDVKRLMAMMSEKARSQRDRLRSRLEGLGGSTSTAKSILAHLLAFTPVSAQMGHAEAEKNTQHLMITYAAAAAEMAMYESLGSAAAMAGDQLTVSLARQLQSEEQEDHRLAWSQLQRTARVGLHAALQS